MDVIKTVTEWLDREIWPFNALRSYHEEVDKKALKIDELEKTIRNKDDEIDHLNALIVTNGFRSVQTMSSTPVITYYGKPHVEALWADNGDSLKQIQAVVKTSTPVVINNRVLIPEECFDTNVNEKIAELVGECVATDCFELAKKSVVEQVLAILKDE